jgi:hypothetical protein
LLDTILLNPGIPTNWAKRDSLPGAFGLQDPEFSQYKLNSFSAMRMAWTGHESVYYPETGLMYNNLTGGYGSCILTPSSGTLDYATASKLLGVDGTYGFKFTMTPTVTVDIEKTSSGSPLQFSIDVSGTGLVLANANVTYNLIILNEDTKPYPSYQILSGATTTSSDGSLAQPLSFTGINGETRTYALVVYTYIYGLKGMNYYVHTSQSSPSIVPLVRSFEGRTVALAHSYSVGTTNPTYSTLSYNASFAIVTEEYTLRQVFLEANATGTVDFGPGSTQHFTTTTVPDNAGLLIVTYKGTQPGQSGIVLAPWGIGAISYPITLGGNSTGQHWVTTDIRQVTIGGLSYQAQLALWSLQGGN